MGYLDQLLGDGERVALVSHPHSIVFWGRVIKPFLVLVTGLVIVLLQAWGFGASLPKAAEVTMPWVGAILIGLASLIILYRYLSWRSTAYVITSRRVIQLRGILGKHAFDSSLDFINDLHLEQPFIGRLLGYGDIEVLTASDETANRRQTYRYVAHPALFLRTLEEQRERRRQSLPHRPVQPDAGVGTG